MQYLGHLAGSDPLRHYLQAQILPQLGCREACPEFRVFRLGGQHSICLYEERRSRLRVVGKFFAPPHQPGTAHPFGSTVGSQLSFQTASWI